MLVDLRAKYLNLPPSGAWPAISGTRFFGSHMADIDADGRDEVLAKSPGALAAGFGVLAYYNAAEMFPSWADMQPPVQLVAAAVAAGSQPSWSGGGASGWTPTLTDQAWFGCIRDLRGTDILVFDRNQSLSLVRWESAPIAGTTLSSYVLNCYWASANGVVPGAAPDQPGWTLSPSDEFFVGNLSDKGVAQIVVFDGSGNLAVLAWMPAAQALQVIWSTLNGTITGGTGQPNWTLSPGNVFRTGDIDGDGIAEILAFDGHDTLALIRFTLGTLQLYWETVSEIYSGGPGAGWTLGAADWFHIADIDGDGQNEIICFDGGSLGAVRWNGQDLRVIGMNSGSVNGSGGDWSLSPTQFNYVGNLEQAGQATILVADPNPSPRVGLLRWAPADGQGFTADFFTTGALTAPGGLTWTLGADNGFTCADVDGDGIMEAVVQSDSAQALGLIKWSGGSLVPLWTASSAAQATPAIRCWGLDLVATAPHTRFEDFHGKQREIYTLASQTITYCATDKLRDTYQIATNATSFAAWGGELLDASPQESAWAWMASYRQDDLDAVFGRLEAELQGAATSWALNTNVDNLLFAIKGQRDLDLKTVKNKLFIQPPQESKATWWFGQIFDAALWGLAAVSVEDFPIFSIVNAMLASLVGSLLASGDNGEPESVEFAHFKARIEHEYTHAKRANDHLQQRLVTDAVKLPLLGRLLDTVFQWQAETGDDIAAATSGFTRLSLYADLVPQMFTLWRWTGQVGSDARYYLSGGWTDVDSPDYCDWYETIEMQFSDIWVLAATADIPGGNGYPTTDLLVDLFDNLGLSLTEFLLGRGPVVAPIQSGGNPPLPNSAPIYVTNSTNQTIWVTIRDLLHITFASGGVNAGQTQVFSAFGLLWSGNYYVEGELTQGAGGPVVGITPEDFSDPPTGYAVQMVEGPNGLQWNKIN